MAFKIPLPVIVKKSSASSVAPNKFGLPHFNRHDMTDIIMIGMGSFGKVSRCCIAGKLFVMKELYNCSASDREKRLFEKEIELLKLVRGHDNIVNITAYGDDAILLNYAEFSFTPFGIERQAVFNVKELLHSCDELNDFDGFQHLQHFICIDVISGLAYLHQNGIVHRDLKPDNVLVCNRHYIDSSTTDVSSWWSTKPVVAKLTDFGESRSAVTATKSLVCTHTTELYRGSPVYMAPEALLQTAPKASIPELMSMDIWSLGMTVFHLINPNISYPFSAEINRQSDLSPVEVLRKLVANRILPTMSAKYSSMRKYLWQPLEAVYRACVKFDPMSRPSVKELVSMVAFNGFMGQCLSGSLSNATSVSNINDATELFDQSANFDLGSKPGTKNRANTFAYNSVEVECLPANRSAVKSVPDNSDTVNSSDDSISESQSIDEIHKSSAPQSVSCRDSQSQFADLNMTVSSVSDDELECSRISHKRTRYINDELNIKLWDVCADENVLALPFDVDGLHKFRIQCKRQDMMNVTKDGRSWSRWNASSRKFFDGVRRIARCKGSYVCSVECCPYVKLQTGPNKVQFRREGGVVVCFSCGIAAKAIACPAVKIWEHEQDAVIVMHKGIHTCRPKAKKISRQQLVKVVTENPGVKPSKLINDEMVKVLTTEDFNWQDLEKMAESFTDLKRIHNVRAEVRNLANPLGNNFEALAVFKKKCDEKDKYFIFKINNRDLNGEPSYVFKSSKAMADLAVSMDKDRDGPMRFEYAYVDAKHDRCRGFKTVTLWAYHDMMRKLVCLAIMEVEEENTGNLTQFWNLINEILQDVTQQMGYKFNPYGFVADENHANWNSIRAVFGENALERVVSCEFHYKQSVERQARKLGIDSSKFKSVAHDMLQALSIHQFELVCSEMKIIVDKNSQLHSWYKWWYDRRTHIFSAFKVADAPLSNLAEVGHSKMQSVGRCYMSILEAAREDVACALRQETDLRVFTSGLSFGGRGRSYVQRKALEYKAGMKRAKAYAAELDDVEIPAARPSVFLPKTGLHRPPERYLKRPSKGPSSSMSSMGPSGPTKNRSHTPLPLAKAAVCKRPYKRLAICLSTIRHRFKTKRKCAGRQSNKPEHPTFHLVLFGTISKLKRCYGCNKMFLAKHRKPPNDLILKYFCHRQYINSEGVASTASNMSAAYFHLSLNCTRMKVPDMEINNIAVHTEVDRMLSEDHRRLLQKFGLLL